MRVSDGARLLGRPFAPKHGSIQGGKTDCNGSGNCANADIHGRNRPNPFAPQFPVYGPRRRRRSLDLGQDTVGKSRGNIWLFHRLYRAPQNLILLADLAACRAIHRMLPQRGLGDGPCRIDPTRARPVPIDQLIPGAVHNRDTSWPRLLCPSLFDCQLPTTYCQLRPCPGIPPALRAPDEAMF